MSKKNPTSKDVAALAGVSPATVSRVFRNEDNVSLATKKMVIDAADRLHYYPNAMARMLKSHNTKQIGFLIPSATNPYYLRHIAKIARLLRSRYGYQAITVPDTDYGQNFIESINLLLSFHVDGIIFSSIQINQADIKMLESIIASEPHSKFLELHTNAIPDATSIYYSDHNNMYRLTRYLIGLGHTRILVVLKSMTDFARESGYLKAYADAGICDIPIPFQYVEESADPKLIIDLIKAYHPTAIVPISMIMSPLVIGAISQMGLRIPQDISFVSYDDSTFLDALSLSALSNDENLVVHMAAEQMHQLIIGDPNSAKKTLLDGLLIDRGSISTLTNRE